MIMDSLRERLHLCVAFSGRSVYEASKEAGLSRMTVHCILQGRTKDMMVSTLFRLAGYFRVAPYWLAGTSKKRFWDEMHRKVSRSQIRMIA
jgi:hypothetical protein